MQVKDPVCMMDVDPETAEYRSEYQGQKYYFCSPGCKREFDKNPVKYTEGKPAQGAHPSESGGGI